MEDNFEKQIDIINKAKNFISNCIKKNIDISLSSMCYLTTWTKSFGHFKILGLSGLKRENLILFTLKNIISISKYHNLEIYGAGDPKKIKNLIVSYCKKENFDQHGNFYDNFFNFSSAEDKFSWLLISLDDFAPSNLKKSIFILKKKNKRKLNLFYLLKILLRIFFDRKHNIKDIFHYITSEYVFSYILMEKLNYKFKNTIIKNAIINYEGIPFQHAIIKTLKSLNKDIKTICYLHCAAWPVQTELLYRERLIDILLVSGNDQKKKLVKFLGWPDEKVSVIPSLRFEKNIKNEFGGYLFVPYEIFDSRKLVQRFENFLGNLPGQSLSNINLRIHPLNKNSLKHKKLALELSNIISKYNNKFTNMKKNTDSIMFGYAAGISVQAMEDGVTIYHFPYNDLIDVFSEGIWENVNVKKLDNYIFKYTLKKKDQMFFVNNEKDKFMKYVDPLVL